MDSKGKRKLKYEQNKDKQFYVAYSIAEKTSLPDKSKRQTPNPLMIYRCPQ